mmetsp:Transcript_7345/g.18559  ORF Transcript_7345/g.18559 Transcript_7345/m.18559 type:complete len:211 (-) Transcript_7345:62-694(-)|eukprot:CAMPEP_0177640152 /NCGR_PEP_ID=MMETSP0447-20121125/6394_1 /TAXON_ID=0 /ORGANISM="Stygamoeba regulata, Strain BSH-02190019" /LENGTH=210 /DNA_ID=CAMNT_0019142211 /DNA_START=379 /DNA_END=1011 /DNA_ORIENTATION=+
MVEIAKAFLELGNEPPPPGHELAALPFGMLIGGPLIAVINAQVQGAIATVNFVKTMGFQPTMGAAAIFGSVMGEPLMVDFKYQKLTADGQGGRQHTVRIPFLSMMPIPSIRVAEVSLTFNARIQAMSSKQIDTSLAARLDAGGQVNGYNEFAYTGQVIASAAFQRSSKEGSQISREYSLAVNVKLVQDEIPSGLERLLTTLDGAVQDRPS